MTEMMKTTVPTYYIKRLERGRKRDRKIMADMKEEIRLLREMLQELRR
ncbi:MAG: hypothetical protein GY861_28685 [bacterium]|nr:hypothetical protein [bacterium]